MVEQVLLGGRRALVVPFQFLAAIALFALGVYLKSLALQILAGMMGVNMIFRWRLLGAAEEVRHQGLTVPADARELQGEDGRRLVGLARDTLQGTNRDSVRTVGSVVEQLVDVLSYQRPSFIVGAAVMLGWLAALGVSAVGMAALATPPAHWHTYEEPTQHWSAQFPAKPNAKLNASGARIVEADLQKGVGFLVISMPFTGDTPDDMADTMDQKVGSQGPRSVRTHSRFAGEPAVRIEYGSGSNTSQVVIFDHADRRFLITGDGPLAAKFLQSFHWTAAAVR